jgi:hypothetical protein
VLRRFNFLDRQNVQQSGMCAGWYFPGIDGRGTDEATLFCDDHCGGGALLLGSAGQRRRRRVGGARPVVGVARAPSPGGVWGDAQEVAANLDTFGSAVINSVSCASAGNCTAGGYADTQAFVVRGARLTAAWQRGLGRRAGRSGKPQHRYRPDLLGLGRVGG